MEKHDGAENPRQRNAWGKQEHLGGGRWDKLHSAVPQSTTQAGKGVPVAGTSRAYSVNCSMNPCRQTYGMPKRQTKARRVQERSGAGTAAARRRKRKDAGPGPWREGRPPAPAPCRPPSTKECGDAKMSSGEASQGEECLGGEGRGEGWDQLVH